MTGIERKPAAGFYQTLLRMWPLFLPVFILLPGITGFPYPPVAGAFSDLSVTHYPNALYLLRSLREWGTIPLWSPSILSGAPFAPNPLAGLWYPPGWLALLLPLPFGFNLIAVMHMIWGGWGVYCLLKSEGAQHAAALVGGIAFCSLPKLFAHYGAGHLTLIYSVCWTPWLLLASRRLPETGKVKPVRLSVEGVVLGLILLADVRWAAPAGVLWLVYVLWQRSARNLKYSWLGTAAQASIQCAVAFCLAAPLLVPLIELTGLSTRANLAPAERSVLALPPGGILGLIYPGSGSTFEWVLYPGCGVLLLAILSPLVGRGRKGLFWLAVGAVSLLLALGPEFPPNRWLSALPGLNLLRVPSRWLFLTGLSLAMAGGHGLDGLLAVDWVSGAARRVRLVLFGAVSASLGLGAGVRALTGDLPGGSPGEPERCW